MEMVKVETSYINGANDQRGVGIRDIPYDTLQKQTSEFQNLTGPLTLPLPFLTILACLSTCLSFVYLYIYILTCQLNQNHGNSLSRDAVKVDFSLALCCLLLHSSSSFYRLYLSNKIDITFSNFRIVRVISEI